MLQIEVNEITPCRENKVLKNLKIPDETERRIREDLSLSKSYSNR